ncbi:uncharacterized protein LOC129607289 [Condylostylus longicornis]|uniref:uncharacterized protein LOC129607289 n=1 Tax=Condylostylus longicornis TaxID=2530218 RepID=UPI00244DAECF|nr:uncharacterized protein LOC129607289 [Condylostylus longicornis]XP_055374153.1 uncharacterized protein LOC129607289 [Condylostylus longicornis]XP_055374154.1 uncharacterized protein LOC129607289 [Condylostylus longicornis]XP_055374155.1 uncharacterized protein LOC129607289 [Condylostylus longicornis]
MSDKKWEPISIEETMCRIYPDQFHILENYGRSDDIDEQYLKNINIVNEPSASKNILPVKQFSIKIVPTENILSDDEDDDDIRHIKEMELNEREQINSMRNVGLAPDINSYVNSNKTFPCIINGGTRKQKKGPPIILDDDFFNVSKIKETNKSNLNSESVQNNLNISSESNATSMTTLTNDISNVSLSSTESSFESVPLKNKPKSIYDILKIARVPPPKEEDKNEAYNKEYPALNATKKKVKKRSSK